MDEFTPEELRRTEALMQEGFYYTSIDTHSDSDSHDPWPMQCNKCKAIGDVTDTPFPHERDCPMLGLKKES